MKDVYIYLSSKITQLKIGVDPGRVFGANVPPLPSKT